ncbi:SWIM zinc finger family protein [Nocardia sp. NPDC006630]|uniref:SWIM zinc finger family protein n=1 Tax=Nocardia sp. NPDC006630 TaxID=3157181 RepID=UPI0033B80ED1
MTTAWTAEQIAALAPDAASLTAARKLRGKWSGGGQHDTALWGLCQGSGSRPYQTVIDISGPAYKCSCPSRKFPCKHALSLLLSWSAGEIAATDTIADFAGEWLAGRAAREAKKSAPESNSPRSGKSATADQRQARVTAGLADLDIWLTDQVRTGLAQADRSLTAFETVAARMVDAQASGVATTLRQLPRAAARSEWPRLLLREYARLHLLATAHRRLETLSPALQASVRTHIGYPTPVEVVRAEPAVRDHWMVVGQRTTTEDGLYTRRVWLRGRTSARWAVLVDHHYGSPSFPQDTPLPGFQVDADIHYYPASTPLRALWGPRHAYPEPFTTIPRSGGIAGALEEQARAVGADPFLRAWPVVLAEVVPVRDESGWYLAEADSTAVPIAVADGEPWRLLGLSGGHPVTVVGEWTADGLVPVAALLDGDVVDIGVAEGTTYGVPSGSAQSDTGSTGLVSAALVGTARRAVDRAGLAVPVAAAAARLGGDPAADLLETVALQDCFARGGVGTGSVELPGVAEDDARSRLPVAAAARLAELLADNSPFLDEWLAVAGKRDFRAPDALASILLERAKGLAAHREPLLRLAGARGRWLAAQHPGWRTLVRAAVEDESVWSHGRTAERRMWLVQLRRRDPAAALAALTGSWGTESGPGKSELLAVLADGLSLADEALLESALDDRRAEVRRTAADLLGRLPDSAFAQRMAERAGAWLTFGRRLRRPELTTTGPGVLDDAARRDGIGDAFGYTAYSATAYRADGAPDLAAEWLHRVVAATPLRHWERVLGPPEQAVRTAMTETMRGAMFAGWSDAALAHRDSTWAQALFAAFAAQEAGESDSEKLRELFALQPLDDQIRHLRRLDSSWLAEIESLLRAMPAPWPGPLAEHVLRLLLDRAQLCADRPGAPSLVPGSYRTLFRAASSHFPVTAADMVTGIARKCGDPYWEQAFDQLAHDLIHRKTMLEELM